MKIRQFIDQSQVTEFRSQLASIREGFGARTIDAMKADPTYGVAGNTLRAMRGGRNTPSAAYQAWAKKLTDSIVESQPIAETSNRHKFEAWHEQQCEALGKSWKRSRRHAISYAHTRKLVDLYVKWLMQFKFSNQAFHRQLNRHAFCALDRQSIEKINKCYGHCMPIKNPSMGHVHNANTYRFCQTLIEEFCREAGGTRLEFDHWAWRLGG